MRRILILGAGKFGQRAFGRLSGKKDTRITVVDKDPKRCEGLATRGAKVVCADGIDYLVDSFTETSPPDLIIPALPLHVAFDWLRTTLPEGVALRPLAVPQQIRVQLPNPYEGARGQLYASYADFICPDDCPEPREICTYTGKPRKGILYETLTNIQSAEFTSVVVRSRQIAPGLGGYRPDDLAAALERVSAAEGPILLSTACKCHGVVQAFCLTTSNLS